jgi:hypothetical protein
LHIVNLVKDFKSNQKDWETFGTHIQGVLACVIGSLPDASTPRDDLKQNLERLRKTLDGILDKIKELQETPVLKRAWSFTKDPGAIADMKREFDEAVALFHLGSAITTGLDVAKLLEGMDIEQQVQRVISKLGDRIVNAIDLSTLPYAEGASWSPSRGCLPQTRIALGEDIWNWIHSIEFSKTAEIWWLNGVAGAGKSAIAHTVAKRCHDEGILASCFFFDREVAGRNGSQKLFSTIARDLAVLNADLAEHIALAVERDQSLATASPIRQFQELVLGVSRWCPVIDQS